MITPVPDAAFEWRDTAWGPILVCTPLEALAPHLFTTRPWALGLSREAGSGAWRDVAAALDRSGDRLIRVKQVHGHHAVNGDAVQPAALPAADIIVGSDGDRTFAVQAADCVPLLIADRRSRAVAAAHAGWRGLSQRVPAETVRQMQQVFESNPDDLFAACGPSIGACCYEVGADVRDAFTAAQFDDDAVRRWFRRTAAESSSNPPMRRVDARGREGHWFFDGWACAREQLAGAGVRPEQTFVAGLCTASHPHLLCSYRRDGALAGRIAGAISPGRPG